jgi:Winged helix DNA-binding domain
MQLLAERLTSQLLAGPPAPDAVAVVRRLLAVQGQDGRGFRLAVRGRTHGLTAADVDSELTDQRTLVVSWLCRGTLHLVATEDFHWLHALTTPPLSTGNVRRLADTGVSPDAAGRAVELIERALAADGPLTRDQLGQRIAAAGIPTGGQALVHILFLATLRGLIVRGPMVGRQHAYVLVRDWLGPPGALPDRAQSLAELARRYLAGHAPSSDRDLARWAGLPLRDARTGLEAIAAELVQRPDGLVALRSAPAAGRPPAARLLGPWDPLLVGWRDRTFITGEHDASIVNGGWFRPFGLIDGRLAAVWRLAAGKVELSPIVPLTPGELSGLQADGADVGRYLGLDPERG